MKRTLFYLIGVVILAVMVYFFVDLRSFFLVISEIKYYYLILVLLLCFPLLGFKAWRWKILLDSQKINYTLYDSFLMYSVASLFSLFIPGKMGDASKIFYLSRDKHDLSASISTIFLDRVFDLLLLILLAFVSLFFFFHFFPPIFFIFICILAALAILVIVFILKDKKKLSRYYFVLNFFIPSKYREIFWRHVDSFFLSFARYNKMVYIKSGILTLLSFLVYLLQVYCLVVSLNLYFNLFFLIPMISFSNLADLLPISFNGIGTRESIFILFFKLLGLPVEKAVALGILQLSVVLFSSIIGVLAWFKNPLKYKANIMN